MDLVSEFRNKMYRTPCCRRVLFRSTTSRLPSLPPGCETMAFLSDFQAAVPFTISSIEMTTSVSRDAGLSALRTLGLRTVSTDPSITTSAYFTNSSSEAGTNSGSTNVCTVPSTGRALDDGVLRLHGGLTCGLTCAMETAVTTATLPMTTRIIEYIVCLLSEVQPNPSIHRIAGDCTDNMHRADALGICQERPLCRTHTWRLTRCT